MLIAYNDSDTEIVGGVIDDTENVNTIVDAVPTDKLIISIGCPSDSLSALLRATRFGVTTRVLDFDVGFTPTQTCGANWLVDTSLSYSLEKGNCLRRVTQQLRAYRKWFFGLLANN